MNEAPHLLNAPSPPYSPNYLGFFECFNEGRFYEAHDVLEHLWLQKKLAPEANFYKALIQLAGAFVHFSKNRPGPGHRLLIRAAFHLAPYPDSYCGLHLPTLLHNIEHWKKNAGDLHSPSISMPFSNLPST